MSSNSPTTGQSYLFKDRRFLPIFLVQLFGCLNDSVLKNSLIILLTFGLAKDLPLPAHTLVMLANIAFIAPFFVFASLAGQIADKFERAYIARIVKAFEIIIVLFSIYAFKASDISLLFVSITALGIHSAFFGPIKYSVLPDQLHKNELMTANGFIEAGTFLSILLGTMIGGFYTINENIVLGIALTFSMLGFFASFFMPKSNNSSDSIIINPNIFQETYSMIQYAYNKKHVYLSILGISWFWFIGAGLLALIPSLTRDILGADENVANLFLITFSIGVGFGSFLANKFFEGEVTTKYVFIAALGISICCIDLYFATHIAQVKFQPIELKQVQEFLSRGHYWRILIDLFLVATCGGLYVVPLYAVMQFFSSPNFRSRVIATNNFINSIFMAGSALILAVFYYLHISIPIAILVVGIINIWVSVHIYKSIPNNVIVPLKLWRLFFKSLFDLMYKVEIKGMENYHKAGDKTVIVANHLSYIDPAIIAAYIPEKIIFAINLTVSKEWWVRPFLKIVKTFPIEPNNPMAIKSLIKQVKLNRKIAIFPEGRISTTGSLMKIYEGPGMIADKAGATVLPIRVDGTQFTRFSKIRHVLKGGFSLRKKITVTILPPVTFEPENNLASRDRRKYISQAIYDVMSDMMFESSNIKETLFESLINSAKIFGMKKEIMDDIDFNRITYRSLLMKSFVMADLVSRATSTAEKVGLILPGTTTTSIVFFGIQASGRVPAMINFTHGANEIISGCKTALVQTIYTSRRFIKKASLENLIIEIKAAGLDIIYLEDFKSQVSSYLKLKCFFASFFPKTYYETTCLNRDPSEVGVILFTSGTEGLPKAVALSHSNILANRYQIAARVDLKPYDSAFNTLPMFHTFGLTGMILMVLGGIKTFFYPSPLHYRIIPEVIYDIGATIMFATDTFLSGYANYAHPYDFYSLRYVFAGAEKLKPRTRDIWLNKFGVRIFEGYGVTEASPVVSANTSMHDKPGTVGRLMPKVQYHISPIEDLQNGGRLYIKGPNIMLGYIKPENPGEIIPPSVENLGDGWYDTGDIASIDEEGYLTLLGRHKRFAKIAGEMVSLATVEELALEVDKIGTHVAISVADDKKGEKIILFTNNPELEKQDFVEYCRKAKVSELNIPRDIVHLKEIPMLSTGKVNYRHLISMAEAKLF